jgi:hypothetical protein
MSEAGGTIRIGDLANPVLTPALEAVIAGTPAVRMDIDAVLAAARAATGLQDFGPEDFRERLGVWLAAFDEDTGLGPVGRAACSVIAYATRAHASGSWISGSATRRSMRCVSIARSSSPGSRARAPRTS